MRDIKNRFLSNISKAVSYDRASDNHEFLLFMRDSGWCWFQDPRAIIHQDMLYIGSVKGNRAGEAMVGIYDLGANSMLGDVVLHPNFDRDDHNSPVFYARKDGSILSTYARHGRDKFHLSRVSKPGEPLTWDHEIQHLRTSEGKKDNVSYMNLYHLEDEERLYNFYRGIEYNPTLVTSEDEGETWSDPVHVFKSEVRGRHRPYPRYAGNGKDTIYVAVTDAHPRNFGNSIYYFEFRNGQFFKADGTAIKSLADDGPLTPSEAEMVYQGTMTTHKPEGFESVPGSAWTSAIAFDEHGHPHIGYALYLSNTDHRYRIATWDGEMWRDREVAFAGGCLYTRESSYTGLITMDPIDPTVVFISTDVDPTTGEGHGGKHEIYRARIGHEDSVDAIDWTPVTRSSPVANIRPMVVRDGRRRVVIWMRGEFATYKNYQLDAVGIVETVETVE